MEYSHKYQSKGAVSDRYSFLFIVFFNCFFIMGQIKEDIAYEGISYDYSTGEVRRY